MLHDLRCTEENPATYENILFRQSQPIPSNTSYNNYNNSGFSERMSIKNDDGTMIDIRKEKNLRGKEEYVEIKYDPYGNVISRKKASNNGFGNENNFSEFNENEDDFDLNYDNNNNTYYEINSEPEIRKAPSVIVETAEAQEIVYEAPAKYDPHVTINKPIFEETVINSKNEISDGIIDNIIRNTLTRNTDNNNFTNNYNTKNDINYSGYDYSTQNYSQSKDIKKTSYNQNYSMNSYNNQYNLGSNNSYNTYNTYTQSNKSNGNKTYGTHTFNYDYQY